MERQQNSASQRDSTLSPEDWSLSSGHSPQNLKPPLDFKRLAVSYRKQQAQSTENLRYSSLWQVGLLLSVLKIHFPLDMRDTMSHI